MRIQAGSVSLSAQHARVQTSHVEEPVEAWVGERADAPRRPALSEPVEDRPAFVHRLSSTGADRTEAPAEELYAGREGVRRLLLEKLFGVKVNVARVASSDAARAADVAAPAQAAPPRAGWGVIADRVETHTDDEALAVQAHGQVTTADGRAIDFALALEQTRHVVTRSEEHLRLGDAKQVDPLALDLDGGGVQLSGEKLDFDLDADGTTESIARLSAGEAWLALDRNGNGAIDDGSELFGPQSGSGFGELAALDADADGFIDEDDGAFTELRLWRGGDGSLVSLKDAGVGAIAVASVSSPLQLAGGTTRETGVYLREDGTAGAVQHVDLDV